MDDNTVAKFQKIQKEYDADMIMWAGPLYRRHDDTLMELVRRNRKRKNALFCLITPGGDANAAYRVIRCLQANYANANGGEVILFVPSLCASAGTLIALGCDRLIMTEHGELGPLDVQLLKSDEVGDRYSGLTPLQALELLSGKATENFIRSFLNFRFEIGFPTKQAAETAAQLTTGLFGELYSQIDPSRVAEISRYLRVAQDYAERIKSKNVKKDTISELVKGYAAHDFVIDSMEAKSLFNEVEEPTVALHEFGGTLKSSFKNALDSTTPVVFYFDDQFKGVEDTPSSTFSDETSTPYNKTGDSDELPKGNRKSK